MAKCVFCSEEVKNTETEGTHCCESFAELIDFRIELHNQVQLRAQSTKEFSAVGFLENASEILLEAGMSGECNTAYYNNERGLRVDGYAFSEIDGTLSIFIIENIDEGWESPMPESEIQKFLARASRFTEKSLESDFRSSLEETDPGYFVSDFINDTFKKETFTKIRITFITDGIFSKRVREITREPIKDKKVVCEAWDLTRLKELQDSDLETEDFEIDFKDLCGGLATLSADLEGSESYLLVLPGQVLSEIYDIYGQRLLESNVRTFLDFRSNVNKGLRNTLRDEPDKFFAYNNGLTATATGVKFDKKDGLKISSLENLQIVNGGQTTSAIYFAPREKNYTDIDLSRVFVQMKLSIIKPNEELLSEEDIENPKPDFKARVAEYANSQNAVNTADLASNHPYHISLDRFSKKIRMRPNEEGVQTKWFYERARGQYLTAKRQRRTDAKKRQFEKEYPRPQLFNKTDLTKYENTWRMQPHIVSKGAQNNFKTLWPELAKEYEKKPIKFREPYFKDIVSKAILFKSTDKSIFTSDWYKKAPGMKAQVVTYSIALLRHLLNEEKKDLNLQNIYDNQSLSDSLKKELDNIGKMVKKNIEDPSFRIVDQKEITNPSEWSKMEICWQKFQQIGYELKYIKPTDVINEDQVNQLEEENQETGQASQVLESIEDLFKIKEEDWKALIEFQKEEGFKDNDKEISLIYTILKSLKPPHKLPTENQQKSLHKIRQAAIDKGFHIKG